MNPHKARQQQLLQQLRAADCKVGDVVYFIYLHRFIESIHQLHYTCTTDEITDAWNETVSLLIGKLQSDTHFELSCEIYNFLYSVAKNKLLNVIRNKKLPVESGRSLDFVDIPAGNSENPDNIEEILSILKNYMESLSETDSLMMKLRYEENMKWKEIADSMDKSKLYLRKRHCEIIRELREMMRGLGWMKINC